MTDVAESGIAVRPPRRRRPRSAGVVETVQRHAALTPDAPAVVCDGEVTDYAALNRAANRLAHRLRALGVQAETTVGILLARSPHLLVAVLGVLKAGGAYLAVDPATPPDRIRFLLADAGAAVLVTSAGLDPAADGVPAVLIGEPGEGPADGVVTRHPDTDPAEPLSASASAYICYTSGSTGLPKGVQVEHHSLTVFAREVVDRLQLGAGDRFLQFASPGFDVLAEELFPVWLAGGTVVVPRGDETGPGGDLVAIAERDRVTVMELPAAYWHEWVREIERTGRRLPPSLRLVIVGAERVLPERLATWQHFGVPLMHVYGITETTVSSTFFRLAADAPAGDLRHLPIGTALPSVDLRILDPELAPLPVGATGELYIGGPGVARGYIGRPGATAERFVADPDPARPGARLYRTGDLVRRRADGNLEFLARVDTQMKVRGFRVEPAEIESAMCRHPDIAQAVVTLHVPVSGDRRLAVYHVPRPGARPLVPDLRRFLSRELPPYLVPSLFVALDAIPLTPHGKIDRDALPAPTEQRPELRADAVAPLSPRERQLADIVAEVLGVGVVGRDDNFFDLGGDSILAIQVVARAQDEGIALSPLDLFEHPTVALMAAVAGDPQTGDALAPRPADAEPVLSLDQERLWLENQLLPGPEYNVGGRQRLLGPLDVGVLEASIRAVLARHDSLRSRFPTVDGVPVQVVDDPDPGWRLEVVDLAHCPAADRATAATRLADEQAGSGFDLARGPMVRCQLVRLSDTDHLLSLTTHHIVADFVSMELFAREVAALYTAGGDPMRADLPALPVQYRDYAHWQRSRLSGAALEAEVGYWREHLAGAPPAIVLPTALRPIGAPHAGGRVRSVLDAETTASLRVLCRRHDVTSFMVVLAGLADVLSRWSGQSGVVVGVSVSNRADAATEPMIGNFVNTLPMHVDLSGTPSFGELLGRVRVVARGGFAHAEVPLDRLVRELAAHRDPRRTPLFQVMLNVVDVRPVARIGDVRVEGMDTPPGPTSFDLVLTVAETGGILPLQLEYDAGRFDAELMEALLADVRDTLRVAALGVAPAGVGPSGVDPAPPAHAAPGPGPDDRVAVLPGAARHGAAGATPLLAPEPSAADPAGLVGWLRENRVTVLYVGPPMLRRLARGTSGAVPLLRAVFVEHAGDLLVHDVAALRRWLPGCRCIATYRTGADGVPAAVFVVPDPLEAGGTSALVPLGVATDGLLRLRGPAGAPARIGEVADLCVGDEPTGDLGRRWPDGTIEYVGRRSDGDGTPVRAPGGERGAGWMA